MTGIVRALALASLLVPLWWHQALHAQAASIVGYWLVTITGEAQTRTFVVTDEAPGANGTALVARYNLSDRAPTPVVARFTQTEGPRQLAITTQAASTIAATEQPDGSFKGTFTLRSGKATDAVLTRITEAQALALVKAAPPAVTSQAPGPDGTPGRTVGDRWEWTAKTGNRDTCSRDLPPDARQVETVVQMREAGGHVSEITGPQPEARFRRAFQRDLSYEVTVNSARLRVVPIMFPLQAGSSWETTLVGGPVVTTLKCEQGASERVKVGTQDWDTIPVTCNGTWRNTGSGNTGPATYRSWYSPAVAAFVRRTVLTYMNGGVCAEVEFQLTSHQRANP